jgi:hypothetical protein
VTGWPLRDEQRATPDGDPALACRYCGQDVALGKHGWRLIINGPSGYEPKDAPYHCGQAPLGYHGPDRSSLF